MSTFILVHGAWHGAWCWDHLVPELHHAGHIVSAPDLPGPSGPDSRRTRITTTDYIRTVRTAVEQQSGKVILVGHSLAGMVISAVAEEIPDRIEKLVYLGAFLLTNGETVNDLENRVGGSLLTPHLSLSEDRHTFNIPPVDVIRQAMYNGTTEQDFRYALERLRPQPVLPFITPVRLSESRYGAIPRIYIECLQDRALPLIAQRDMIEHTRCEKVFTLEAGHAPFFSRYNDLAGLLARL